MNNKILLPLLAIFISTSLFAKPPTENLSIIKKKLAQYHDSGQYFADIAAAIKPAKKYLISRINNNPDHKKLAIVFDLDETLFSGYDVMKNHDFGMTLKNVRIKNSKSNATEIPAADNLYKFAKKQHLAIFLISGRQNKFRKNTAYNLHKLGLYSWNKLYLKPSKDKQKSIAPFKTTVRKKITKAGYDIVLNVGDQDSDLRGGYADKIVIIPNPYYCVP